MSRKRVLMRNPCVRQDPPAFMGRNSPDLQQPGKRVRPTTLFLQPDDLIGEQSKEEENMLYYALVFLLVSLIAGAVGFFALAGVAAMIAKVLFILFLIFFLVALIGGRRRG